MGHGTVLRGDYGTIEIGSGTAVEEGAVLHAPPDGLCRIGKRVTLGHGCIVHGDAVEDYALIGLGSVVSLHAVVGSWAIVAEGCVVKNKQVIPEKVVVAGNPARFVRNIESRDIEFWSWAKQLYVDLAQRYLREGMEKIG